MAATKAIINWSSVTWNSILFKRITNVAFGKGGTLLPFSGDGDTYVSILANVMNAPHVTITGADVYAMNNSIPTGTVGTMVCIAQDALLATGGMLTFTMINCMAADVDSSAAHAQYGTATASFQAFSADGTTNPLTFAEA